jgi:hypothetical protein
MKLDIFNAQIAARDAQRKLAIVFVGVICRRSGRAFRTDTAGE